MNKIQIIQFNIATIKHNLITDLNTFLLLATHLVRFEPK